MRRYRNERFDESYIEETLDNGLKVILWEKKNFDKSYFMMATPLGALDLNQVDEEGNNYHFPAGIAHFLEHKMFEDENCDVMDLFSQMGANVNAFTSYSETAYYFSTSENPIKPLQLLLDFVQELKINEKSVEKEKGIIIQELEMYQQMSEIQIINETLSSLYHEHPLKYDIGGDSDSVNSITKKQLEECYALNYHPSKMLLIGVSSYDSEALLNTIKENQNNKKFTSVHHVKRMIYKEPNEVFEKEKTVRMDIEMPKVSIAYKLDGVIDPVERNKKEWSYKILFDLYFSSLNEQYQQWLDDEIINNSFNFEIDFGEDYGLVMFYSESKKKDDFVRMIHDVLSNINNIDDTSFNNLKNRYFGQSINALNNHKQIAIGYMRNYFAQIDYFESIEVIETINKEDLLKIVREIDLENSSVIEISK